MLVLEKHLNLNAHSLTICSAFNPVLDKEGNAKINYSPACQILAGKITGSWHKSFQMWRRVERTAKSVFLDSSNWGTLL